MTNSLAPGAAADPAAQHAAAGRPAVRPDRHAAARHPHRQQPDDGRGRRSRTWPASTCATCSARVAGVVAPVVVGGKDRTVLIYLDPKKLEARDLSAVDVVKRARPGNMMVSPGTAYFGDNQVSSTPT